MALVKAAIQDFWDYDEAAANKVKNPALAAQDKAAGDAEAAELANHAAQTPPDNDDNDADYSVPTSVGEHCAALSAITDPQGRLSAPRLVLA